MDNRRVVLTGGHSYLGQKFIGHLLNSKDVRIDAIITPWANEEGLVKQPERLRYIKADLTKPVSDELREALGSADQVVHFAWIRGSNLAQVLEANQQMIDNVSSYLNDPKSFCLISSVAASPETPSTYGQAKFKISQRVLESGGTVLVAGLIVDDEPKGPYKLLVDVVKALPLSVRAAPGAIKLYPLKAVDFVEGLAAFLRTYTTAGSYRLFPATPVDFNEMISSLEMKFPRKRMPVRFSYRLAMAAIKTLRGLHVPPMSLHEKLLTFLYKDENYLRSHQRIEGFQEL